MQTTRPRKRLKLLLLLSFITSICFWSCTKIDVNKESLSIDKLQKAENFFKVSPNTDPIVLKIIDEIKKRNNRKEFVSGFAVNNGYPIWDKAILGNKRKNGNSNNFSGGNASDTLVFIPFALVNQASVNGYILATITDSIGLSYSLAKDYKAYPFNPDSTQLSASNFAMRIMIMENQVFGYTKFNITDERLFHEQSTDYSDTSLYNLQVILNDSTPSNSLLASYCYSSIVVRTCSECHLMTCTVNPPQTTTIINCIWYDDGNSGNPPPPGGGGGGGGEIPPAFPCTPVINPSVTNNQNTGSSSVLPGGPLPPCPGPGTGWVPTPPYVCNYQLSTRDQEVLDQINAEDNAANSINQNNNCKGTKRTGNINFQGTKEHWIIQLDYVSKNPLHGEIEYSIPNASMTNPTNRGFADIVETHNGDMFEIKPNNNTGLVNGSAEVANYVTKAILNCGPPTQIGTTWHEGSTYPTVVLPTGSPSRFLKSELIAPGVIGYSYLRTTNPIPSPIAVPQSAIDKLKQLIDRLKNNTSDANRIIAEYMNEHPELVTYIKSAAIGAGVAIIVGTILEDIITAGAGVLDDVASFALAYKIIRFAIIL